MRSFLKPGTLIVVSGPPGAAKTSIGTALAAEVARDRDLWIPFFSKDKHLEEDLFPLFEDVKDVPWEIISRNAWNLLFGDVRTLCFTPLTGVVEANFNNPMHTPRILEQTEPAKTPIVQVHLTCPPTCRISASRIAKHGASDTPCTAKLRALKNT